MFPSGSDLIPRGSDSLGQIFRFEYFSQLRQQGDMYPAAVHVSMAEWNLQRLFTTALIPMIAYYLLFSSYVALYGFYLLIEFLWVCVAWLYAEKAIRKRIRKTLYYLPLMPIYRIITFVFRVSVFFRSIYDPFEWNVSSPIIQLQESFNKLEEDLANLIDQLLGKT